MLAVSLAAVAPLLVESGVVYFTGSSRSDDAAGATQAEETEEQMADDAVLCEQLSARRSEYEENLQKAEIAFQRGLQDRGVRRSRSRIDKHPTDGPINAELAADSWHRRNLNRSSGSLRGARTQVAVRGGLPVSSVLGRQTSRLATDHMA